MRFVAFEKLRLRKHRFYAFSSRGNFKLNIYEITHC